MEEEYNYKWMLQNLLAIIHRDGGHYTQKHGIHKATQDAMELIAQLRMKIDTLEEEIDNARKSFHK